MKSKLFSAGWIAGLGVLALTLFVFSGSAWAGGVDKPDPVYQLAKWHGWDVIKGEALVQFKPGVPQAAALALHESVGTVKVETVAEGLDRVAFADDKDLEDVLAAYNRDPSVDFAEPNMVYWPTFTPNDTYWGSQWGPKKINCATAWDIYTGNGSDVVAMIDTGVDMDHPDLQAHYAWGYDYYSGDPNPDDQSGHGSHTAGTAAAVTNNGKGVAGVAFNCKFAAYRVGDYYLSNSAIVSAINDAKNKGALVNSMSFGGGPSTSIHNALTSAYNAGMVNVASAGNDGSTAKSYPAAYSEVIAVAASNSSDNRPSWSNYGSWVDVAAPGVNILSCYKNKNYAYMDGTSMSCPHVSGMALLLYSFIGGNRTKANSDIVRNAIQDSAVNVGTWVKYGRIDVRAGLDLLAGSQNPPVIDSISPSQVEAFMGGTVTVSGSHFTGANEVDVGSTVLGPSEFTVMDDSTITFSAPTATTLGQTTVYVKNTAGTSNPGYFTYVETDPPTMYCPTLAQGGENFTWGYGGGAGDYFMLLVSTDSTTFTYQGYPVLAYFTTLYQGYLNAAGTGSLTLTIPTGLQGLTFYSEVLFWDHVTSAFDAASSIRTTLIIN